MNQELAAVGSRWERRIDWFWVLALLGVVVLAWCTVYNRWTLDAWQTPINYDGDALPQMATTKAFASGEAIPILSKTIPSLGAPFTANWDDFPITEEGIFAGLGLLVRLCGLFLGSNLGVLSAQLLSAAAFYFVARALRVDRIWAAVGAFLFSMSHFAFSRGLSHLVIASYWHVPLGLLVVWWCVRSTPVTRDRKRIFVTVATAVIFGVQNIYYSGIFFQFLVLAAFVCLVRRDDRGRIFFPLLVASIVLSVVLLMNADTLFYRFAHGPNPAALTREYAGLEKYALKPIELFLPFPHRLNALQGWVTRAYFWQTEILGEIGSAYLGIIGLAALGLFGWKVIRALVCRPVAAMPWQFGFLLWLVFFSIIGGINSLLGVFGLIFFRATNRYSIVILALLLLFLCEQLTGMTRQWRRGFVWLLAGLMVVTGFFDQTPPDTLRSSIRETQTQVRRDARFASSLEAKLAAGAMVFQLPVMDFPEATKVGTMDSYDHFRPYLYTRTLHYSFGGVKGRPRERWQGEALRLGLPRLFQDLEQFGFAAVMINKKGYADSGAAIVSALAAFDRRNVLAESDDLLAIALVPARQPKLPPVFAKGWSDLETDGTTNWRWSLGNADLILTNPLAETRNEQLAFRLGTVQPRQVEIYFDSHKLYSREVASADDKDATVILSVSLQPGSNTLQFKTNKPGAPPSSTDSRPLAFRVIDFKVGD